jgi:hypothetical protein
MPRKRPTASDTDPSAEPSAADGSRPATKKEAVRLALADGIKSPTKIAAHLKETYGMDVTPAHVSTIKGGLKKGRRNGRRKGKPGPKPKQAGPAAGKKAGPRPGLTPQDLAALAEIAERVGGFEQLQEFLSALKRIR